MYIGINSGKYSITGENNIFVGVNSGTSTGNINNLEFLDCIGNVNDNDGNFYNVNYKNYLNSIILNNTANITDAFIYTDINNVSIQYKNLYGEFSIVYKKDTNLILNTFINNIIPYI